MAVKVQEVPMASLLNLSFVSACCFVSPTDLEHHLLLYHTNSCPVHQEPYTHRLERHQGKKEETTVETTDVYEVERDWLSS